MKNILFILSLFISLASFGQDTLIGKGGKKLIDTASLFSPYRTAINKNTDSIATKLATRDSALLLKNFSNIFPNVKAYKIYPYKTTYPEQSMELLNYGNPVNDGSSKHSMFAGMVRYSYALGTFLNVRYDTVTNKYIRQIAAWPAVYTEHGTEGITLHVIDPAFDTINNTWNASFQSRVGVWDSKIGISSGVFNQSFVPNISVYDSFPTSSNDTHRWYYGSGSAYLPMQWYQSDYSKGIGECIRLESNGNAFGNSLGIFFRKSRGVYSSKVKVNTGDAAMYLVGSLYDGAKYQTTARILSQDESTPSANVAPQRIKFQTSATDSGAILDRVIISAAGITSLYSGASVASASAITPTGNLFHVTGTTTITSITSTNITAGTTITIIFDGALTFTDGSNLKLAGNFTTAADATITLAYDGTNWYEQARSTNDLIWFAILVLFPTLLFGRKRFYKSIEKQLN